MNKKIGLIIAIVTLFIIGVVTYKLVEPKAVTVTYQDKNKIYQVTSVNNHVKTISIVQQVGKNTSVDDNINKGLTRQGMIDKYKDILVMLAKEKNVSVQGIDIDFQMKESQHFDFILSINLDDITHDIDALKEVLGITEYHPLAKVIRKGITFDEVDRFFKEKKLNRID
ncbi:MULTISPECIES: hypothetical protein [unclassified Granulicatella]|uniref:hypothetical protein n=1 Tax=unclassified Granulicatella TaxID=2630493 RepID=UPI0010740FF5|nr:MULTISPECIES: hypothetical protein [unclassified Granulicatella]MBF0780361.1 hypothetical protein [Granulicatella sp. 19428wC4_WM01]TFU95493.1 hypothetical protein E4T68_04580 [Granulicatella sp. WM01]